MQSRRVSNICDLRKLSRFFIMNILWRFWWCDSGWTLKLSISYWGNAFRQTNLWSVAKPSVEGHIPMFHGLNHINLHVSWLSFNIIPVCSGYHPYRGFLKMGMPSGKLTSILEIHNFLLVNPLFLWPFSIANCKPLPKGNPPFSEGVPMVFPLKLIK